MPRSPLFGRMAQAMRTAAYCDKHRLSSREGLERARAVHEAADQQRITRRDLLRRAGTTAAVGAAAMLFPWQRALARGPKGKTPSLDVAIVGAGLAGLTCADTLLQAGIKATLYDARDRTGGRQHSMGASFAGPVSFPGQVVERGGELIDNLHKTMLGYAQEFGFAKEDMGKLWKPGETFWHFRGARVSEETIVDEFRDLVDAMRPDLTQLSGEVTAASFTDFDRTIDETSLADYLDARGAGQNVRAAINASYTGEYGLAIDEQSALNMIFFIHADKRSRFTPFGVYSDERYHLVGGNQQIARALEGRFTAGGGRLELGSALVSAGKLADGRVELTFERGNGTFTSRHEAVVFAMPFSTLRHVTLQTSLGLPDWKLFAIQAMRYGTNAKLNVGFNGRFWKPLGSNGETWSDLPNHQLSWEVNPVNATADHAVLVDYTGGALGAGLRPQQTNQEANRFLDDLDRILPGAKQAAARDASGKVRAHLAHWPSDPFARGSYTCNHPGYFTTIAGNEATPVGNLYFAGEHTDPFYEWQGFMEGAANSGIAAASRILADLK